MFKLMSGTCNVSVSILLLVTLVGPVHAVDIIWVAGENVGSDEFGDGSSGAPYRTISWAMQQANPDDTIKVLTGDYGVDAGETFPVVMK